MNCSAGNSPDTLLRLAMPVGPFNEPWGTDCYFNQTAYQVLGTLVVIGNGVLFAIILLDYFPRRGDLLLQTGSIGLLVSCVSQIVFVFCGAYAPWACRGIWPVSVLGAMIFVMAYLWKLITSGVQLLDNLRTHTSVFQLYGGRVKGGLLLAVTLGCAVTTVLSGFLSAILFDPQDEAAALVAQQVHFATLGLWSGVIIYGQQVIASKFIVVVEEITASAQGLRNGGGGGGSILGSTTAASPADATTRTDEVAAVLWRFKFCKRYVPMVAPISCGANLLLSFVIPPFYFLVLSHLANCTFVGFLGWYGLTPTKRRMRVLRVVTRGWLGQAPASSKAAVTALSSPRQQGEDVIISAAPNSPVMTRPTLILAKDSQPTIAEL